MNNAQSAECLNNMYIYEYKSKDYHDELDDVLSNMKYLNELLASRKNLKIDDRELLLSALDVIMRMEKTIWKP